MRSNYDQRICPELNDAVFTDKPPFDILGLPHCAKKDDITINLHMSKFGFECGHLRDIGFGVLVPNYD